MSGPAQVRSTEAIVQFRAALAQFEARVQNVLDELSGELRRAEQWLQHDCPADWRRELKSAEDWVHQAKLDLERCLLFPVAGERPACREEKAVLKQAKRRVEFCREKSEQVRHWKRQMHHEQFEYEGRVGQLRRLLESDLPLARARLQQIVHRLDEYQLEQAPSASAPPPAESIEPPSKENP